jgi:hypothetical protein
MNMVWCRFPCWRAIVAVGALGVAVASFAQSATAQRWTNANQVNLRSEPSLAAKVLTRLPLAAEVILLAQPQSQSPSLPFCEVERRAAGAESLRGFIACQYLTEQSPRSQTPDVRLVAAPVAAKEPPALASTVPAAQESAVQIAAANVQPRVITGRVVNLRTQPAIDAPVIVGLPANTQVNLIANAAGGRFCEVDLPRKGQASQRGFVACEFLGRNVPVVVSPVPVVEPTKAPTTKSSAAQRDVRQPLLWGDMKLAWFLSANEIRTIRDKARNTPVAPNEVWEFSPAYRELQAIYGLVHHKLTESDAKQHVRFDEKLALVMDRIELPEVAPSLFQSLDDIAPPYASAQELAAKWRIPLAPAGRYGLRNVTDTAPVLQTPVYQHSVYWNGALAAAPSRAPPPDSVCDKASAGFRYGEPSAALLDNEGRKGDAAAQASSPVVFQFYARRAVVPTNAKVQVGRFPFQFTETGFHFANLMYLDINGDGVADLVVWEGTGQSPQAGQAPQRLDPYQRYFFANIGGAWYYLGGDEYRYGRAC